MTMAHSLAFTATFRSLRDSLYVKASSSRFGERPAYRNAPHAFTDSLYDTIPSKVPLVTSYHTGWSAIGQNAMSEFSRRSGDK
jgi:hypothetical protein